MRLRVSSINRLLISLTILALPFDIWAVGTIAGYGIKPIWAVGGLLIAGSFLMLCLRYLRLRMSRTGIAILLLNVIAIVSAMKVLGHQEPNWEGYLTVLIQFLFVTLLFFCVTSMKLRESQLRAILRFWILICFLLSVYAIYQVMARPFELPLAYLPITNPSMDRVMVGGSFGPFIRPSSVFAEPSFFGSFLLAPLSITAIFWLYRRKVSSYLYRSRVMNWIIFGTIIVAFILTFSMGAYVAFAGAMGVAFFNRRLARRLVRLGFYVVVVLILVGWGMEQIIGANFSQVVWVRTKAHIEKLAAPTERIGIDSPFARTSVTARSERAAAALDLWAQHPILGVGLNNFGQHYPPDVKPRIHGAFLQASVEMGLLGLIALLGVFVSALASIRRFIVSGFFQNLGQRALMMGLYYGIWATFFDFVVAGNWFNPAGWQVLSMGILSLHHIAGRDKFASQYSSRRRSK